MKKEKVFRNEEWKGSLFRNTFLFFNQEIQFSIEE